MKKLAISQWLWTMVCAIALLLMTGCSFSRDEPSTTPNVATHPAATSGAPSTTIAPPFVVPLVNTEQLMAHVRALNFERYQERDRERTRQYISQRLQDYGWQPQRQAFEDGVNIIARRSGTATKAGAILVTAHFDTVPGSPGADDNASAIAAALEIARLLGRQPTPRPLQFAFFDREEVGLLGSLAYTAVAANLTNLAGVVNLEMLGYACYKPGCQKYPEGLTVKPPSDRGDFLAVVGDQEHLPLLQAFQQAGDRQLPSVITLPIPFKGLLTPDVLRSDHAPFWARNIGAVMVSDTANFRNPNYHQTTDTPATLTPIFFSGATQQVLHAVSALLQSRTSLETTLSK